MKGDAGFSQGKSHLCLGDSGEENNYSPDHLAGCYYKT